MSRGTLDSSLHSIEFQLHNWIPFTKTLESDSPRPNYGPPSSKRPCRSDRATSFSIESILDMSKLSLFDDDDKPLSFYAAHKRWLARKRRRRGGSRSVSGRSSDRKCRSVSASGAANGTCSDFPVAAGGTDSSGEMFGEANWASDVSEREGKGNVGGGGGERQREQGSVGLCGQFGNCDNESGYGSEPGYRGDEELGYGDEVDEEEVDSRALFWSPQFGANTDSKLERVGENSLQKAHHRGRRKKHDLRMVDALT